MSTPARARARLNYALRDAQNACAQTKLGIFLNSIVKSKNLKSQSLFITMHHLFMLYEKGIHVDNVVNRPFSIVEFPNVVLKLGEIKQKKK